MTDILSYVLLPNQLFDKKYLKNSKKVILYEHPHFFRDYKYNKKKILLHRASMKCHQQYLNKNNYKVSYVEFSDSFKIDRKIHLMFDPLIRIKRLKIDQRIVLIDSFKRLLVIKLGGTKLCEVSSS